MRMTGSYPRAAAAAARYTAVVDFPTPPLRFDTTMFMHERLYRCDQHQIEPSHSRSSEQARRFTTRARSHSTINTTATRANVFWRPARRGHSADSRRSRRLDAWPLDTFCAKSLVLRPAETSLERRREISRGDWRLVESIRWERPRLHRRRGVTVV